jgi:ABC-type multidrug transport system permease subunit
MWKAISIAAVQSSKYGFTVWKVSWNENGLQSIVLMRFFYIGSARSIKIAYAAKQQEDALSDSSRCNAGIANK